MHLLKEAGVKTRVAVVAMRQNQHTIEETLQMVKEFGFEGSDSVDLVRAFGRGKGKETTPSPEFIEKYGLMRRPIFTTNESDFNNNRLYNPCWAGKIAVDSSGDVNPCVTASAHKIGKVPGQSIEEIVEGSPLRRLWSVSKDNIEICHLCEYRYTCGDCRPLAIAETGNFFSKTQRCTYDPIIGEWH
jgi:radical SAM protein with 4Fe4S-binding SPASM domain